MLDVGSGAGLFLGLLASERRISEGVGLDTNPDAIAVARGMAKRATQLGFRSHLRFEQIEPQGPWPSGHFDVVSLIDVMHHIPPPSRRELFRKATSRLRHSGTLIYKDISARPRWRAWANRLHDLVIAKQWIQLVPIRQVEEWAIADQLKLEHADYIPRLWYGHDLRVWSLV